MARTSTLVLFLRTSERKLAFCEAKALKATELVCTRSATSKRSKLAEPSSDSTLSATMLHRHWGVSDPHAHGMREWGARA